MSAEIEYDDRDYSERQQEGLQKLIEAGLEAAGSLTYDIGIARAREEVAQRDHLLNEIDKFDPTAESAGDTTPAGFVYIETNREIKRLEAFIEWWDARGGS